MAEKEGEDEERGQQKGGLFPLTVGQDEGNGRGVNQEKGPEEARFAEGQGQAADEAQADAQTGEIIGQDGQIAAKEFSRNLAPVGDDAAGKVGGGVVAQQPGPAGVVKIGQQPPLDSSGAAITGDEPLGPQGDVQIEQPRQGQQNQMEQDGFGAAQVGPKVEPDQEYETRQEQHGGVMDADLQTEQEGR